MIISAKILFLEGLASRAMMGDNGNDGKAASAELTSTSPSPVAATETDII